MMVEVKMTDHDGGSSPQDEKEQQDIIDHHRDRHNPKEPNRDGGRSHDQVGQGGEDDNQQRKRRPVRDSD